MTKKKKEKTAQNKGQWITYVVYMLLGAACGIFDLMYMDTAGQSEKRAFFGDYTPCADAYRHIRRHADSAHYP